MSRIHKNRGVQVSLASTENLTVIRLASDVQGWEGLGAWSCRSPEAWIRSVVLLTFRARLSGSSVPWGLPVHHRRLDIPGLHPVNASGSCPSSSSGDDQKYLQTFPDDPRRRGGWAKSAPTENPHGQAARAGLVSKV